MNIFDHPSLSRINIMIASKLTALLITLYHEQQRHAYYHVVLVFVLVLVLAYTSNNPVQTSVHLPRTESSRPPLAISPRSHQTMDCMANAAASAVLRVIKIVAWCGCGCYHALLLDVLVHNSAALFSLSLSLSPLALSRFQMNFDCYFDLDRGINFHARWLGLGDTNRIVWFVEFVLGLIIGRKRSPAFADSYWMRMMILVRAFSRGRKL